MIPRCSTPRRRGERGVVGGAEALAFGTLVLLTGTLLCIHLWSVVEARVALDAAAREYLRTYTTAADEPSARRDALSTARVVLVARGTPHEDLRVVAPEPARFGPCGVAEVEISTTVQGARLPFVGSIAATIVTVHHRELIDAHREVSAHAEFDPTATPCH